MNKDDQALLNDPESSGLDYSLKNKTGIKDNNSESKKIKIKYTKEVRNINIKSDLKDATVSSINNEADNIKTDLVFETGNANNTSSEIGNSMIVPNKAISCTTTKDCIMDKLIFKQPGINRNAPLKLAVSTGNNPKQVAIRGIIRSDGALIPIKSIKQIHINDENLKKFIMVNSRQTVLSNESTIITGSSNTSSRSLLKVATGSSLTTSVENKPSMRTIGVPTTKIKHRNSSEIENIGNKIVFKADSKKSLKYNSFSSENVSSPKFLKLSPAAKAGLGNVQISQLSGKSSGVHYVSVLNDGVLKENLTPIMSQVILKNQNDPIPIVNEANKNPLLERKIKDVENYPRTIQNQLGQQIFTTIPTTNKTIVMLKKVKVEQLNENLKHKYLASSSSTTVGTTIVSKPRILNNLTHLASNLNMRKYNNNLNNEQQREQLTKNYPSPTAGSSLNMSVEGTVSNIKIMPENLVPKASQNVYSSIENTLYHGTSSLTAQLPFSKMSLNLPNPDTDVGIKRKHCKCTKSQCLKMYCNCFAGGKFCKNCSCKNCLNNFEGGDERNWAIEKCLDRNPDYFKTKIANVNVRCNCKKSHCLMKYCECYLADLNCTSICQCFECRNKENLYTDGNINIPNLKINNDIRDNHSVCEPATSPHNLITKDIVDASVQCMLAQTDQCIKNGHSAITTERKILEEFGRCLSLIVGSSTNNSDQEIIFNKENKN